MKLFSVCFLVLLLSLCLADVSLAHRVTVFAFVDGDAVRVECSFRKNQKVKHGKLVVSDHETGAFLLEGTTDVQGVFRFRPDAAFLKTGHGLNILLQAGEGHQNDWQMTAEELQALSPAGCPAKGGVGGVSVSETSVPQAFAEEAVPPVPVIDAAALEALVGKVMDAKLAPVKQALARQENDGPDVRDIVGGIGWILGLLGLAAYLRYRPGPSGQRK